MKRIIASLVLALAVVPGVSSADNDSFHCSGIAPTEMRCSVAVKVGKLGAWNLEAWTTPGMVGKVAVEVVSATGSVKALCTATGDGLYATCAGKRLTGVVRPGQAATLIGTVSTNGVPATGRWMVEVNN